MPIPVRCSLNDVTCLFKDVSSFISDVSIAIEQQLFCERQEDPTNARKWFREGGLVETMVGLFILYSIFECIRKNLRSFEPL
jgi:hypothetical protein